MPVCTEIGRYTLHRYVSRVDKPYNKSFLKPRNTYSAILSILMVLNTHHHTLKEWKTCIYLYHLQCELTLTLIRLPNAVFHVEQYFMKPVSHPSGQQVPLP